MEYQIEKCLAFRVFGLSYKVQTATAFQVIPGFWGTAWQDGTMEKLFPLMSEQRPVGVLGIAVGGRGEGAEEMTYMIGVAVHATGQAGKEDQPLPVHEGFETYEYPEATWVVVNADGDLPKAVQDVYGVFYQEWLPKSGHELADLPVIESYLDGGRQEVWFALKD